MPDRKPWFSLHLPNYTHADTQPAELFDRVVEQARAAEEAGFAQVTVMDHVYQIPGVGRVDEPMLEGWSVLNALARETRRVRLGTQVTGVTYRNPALLAKMATTLDITSGGRAMLGLGAAWNEEEHVGYGYEFPSTRERMDRLDEALMIIRAMFREERPSFTGAHHRIHEALNVPRPVHPGGPRIMVGGVGERRTLRIAAKHADMTHWFALGLEPLKRKTEILFGYCHELGRDPAEIERTIASPVIVLDREAGERHVANLPADRRSAAVIATGEHAADALRPYVDDGFTGFVFSNTMYRTPDQIARVGEVLALLR